MPERLHKFLARAGIASRREAERLIAAGEVTVNGKVVTTPGTSIDGDHDSVIARGRKAEVAARRYFILYKPPQVVSTAADPQKRRTVADLAEHLGGRLFPVGRLDYDAEGALLLTDDGAATHRLLHPKFGVERVYLAKVRNKPDDATLEKLRAGVRLEDGMASASEAAIYSTTERNCWLKIVVAQGRGHLIKRMCAAVGHPVMRLFRPSHAGVSVKGMAPGEVRELEPREVAAVVSGEPLPEPPLFLPARHGPSDDARVREGRGSARRVPPNEARGFRGSERGGESSDARRMGTRPPREWAPRTRAHDSRRPASNWPRPASRDGGGGEAFRTPSGEGASRPAPKARLGTGKRVGTGSGWRVRPTPQSGASDGVPSGETSLPSGARFGVARPPRTRPAFGDPSWGAGGARKRQGGSTVDRGTYSPGRKASHGSGRGDGPPSFPGRAAPGSQADGARVFRRDTGAPAWRAAKTSSADNRPASPRRTFGDGGTARPARSGAARWAAGGSRDARGERIGAGRRFEGDSASPERPRSPQGYAGKPARPLRSAGRPFRGDSNSGRPGRESKFGRDSSFRQGDGVQKTPPPQRFTREAASDVDRRDGPPYARGGTFLGRPAFGKGDRPPFGARGADGERRFATAPSRFTKRSSRSSVRGVARPPRGSGPRGGSRSPRR